MLSTRRFLLVSAVMFVPRRFVDNVLINSFYSYSFLQTDNQTALSLTNVYFAKTHTLETDRALIGYTHNFKKPLQDIEMNSKSMLEYVYVSV